MTAPLILTCGEPAGIGPELAPLALAAGVPFVWLGDPRHLPPGTPWSEVQAPGDTVPPGALPVLRHDFAAPATPGRPDPANAQGVIDAIARAVGLAMRGEAGGICTLPISKQALKEGAGFAFPGHTEFLASLCGAPRPVMMLAAPALRVVPVTIHIPLAQVPVALTMSLLEETLRITRAGLISDFGLPAPRIAVAGLNPHAGEGGAMGREEVEVISPVLTRLRAEGWDLAGPLAAGTLFHPAARARYDAAVCMYHDQALIPIKTIAFDEGVNVTLGLDFVRTSPDHGTALDIAGRGIADPSSLIAALVMARDLGARRAAGRA